LIFCGWNAEFRPRDLSASGHRATPAWGYHWGQQQPNDFYFNYKLSDSRYALLHFQESEMFIRKLIGDTKAATAIEYGLIAALIAVAAITAMRGIGTSLNTTFTNVSTAMKGTTP